MLKQKLYLISLTLFVFAIVPGFSQPINPGLLSMGSYDLVFFDMDNDLNGYDFGDNPAALVENQKEMWMSVRTWWNHARGDFHRPLDPKSQSQLHLQAEGVKPIGTGAAFRGFIRYYTEELHNVYRALEDEPYHDIFTPIDTTTGTYDYYGPILGFEYSQKITSWAAFGGRIEYQLQDGLKREPTKAKVDGRMIHGVIGTHLKPHRALSLGFAVRPFSVQYRINANKSFLLDYPIIYKYFGDSLLVKNEKVDTYDRTTRGEGYSLDGIFVYQIASGVILAGKGGYHIESKKIDEGSSAGQRDIDDYGSWQKQGPWIEATCRINPASFPVTLGITLGWRSWDSWARTPRFQTLFEEMKGDWTRYGIGIAYQKPGFPLKLGLEYHTTNFNEEKHNYYQSYKWKRENKVNLIKSGGELKITSSFLLRFGGALGETIAEYHLSFDPVRVMQVSLGAGIRLNHVQVDVSGVYEKHRPSSGDLDREKIIVLVELSQRN
jgi:hypothetical protein